MKKLIFAMAVLLLGGFAFATSGTPAKASAIVVKPADVRGHVAQDLVQEVRRRRYYRYRRGPRVHFYFGPYYGPYYYYRPYRYRRYRYYRRCYWRHGRRYCRW